MSITTQQLLFGVTPAVNTDPYFSSVSLLLHADGTDGSTTFTDHSPRTKTPSSVLGNARIRTALSVFGGASGYCDGAGDYIQYASHADFAFGTGDFTIEFRMNSANVTGASQRGLFQTSTTAGGLSTSYANGITFLTGSNGVAAVTGAIASNIAGTYVASSGAVVSPNTWYAVSITRISGEVTIRLNGTTVASGTAAGNCTGSNFALGGYYSTGYLYQGYFDELRITKGVGRYTADYSVLGTPFPNS